MLAFDAVVPCGIAAPVTTFVPSANGAGGVDFALIETMSALEEVQSAIEGVREAGLPVIVTMSFDTNLRTMMGVRPGDAVTHLAQAGADAVLAASIFHEGTYTVAALKEALRTFGVWVRP